MKQQLLYSVNEEYSGGMASNIAKWWKNKFNGYRQFTVLPTDCSDGRPSDTEELLGGRNPESIPIHQPPTVQKNLANNHSTKTSPPRQRHHQQSHPQPTRPRRVLDFEQFECDVQVEGGGYGSGVKQRQEFSFTLYDLEGHGKITKDDIASLVKTIYDTLGSSITVPHYGSKTIKVKLTVAPEDQLKRQQQPPSQHLPPNPYHTQNTLNNVSSSKLKRDLNVTIRESRLRRPVRRRKQQQSSSAPTNHSPSTQVTSLTSSTLPGRGETISSGRSSTSSSSGDTPLVVDLEVNEDQEADSTVGLLTAAEPDLVGGLSKRANKRISHASSMGFRRERVRRYSRNPRNVTTSTQPPPPPQSTSQPTSSNSNSYFQQQHPERKSGSMQREELLQIIQANMDKNNLTFQTSRKAYNDRNGFSHPNYRPRQKTMHSELFDSSRFGGVAGFGGVTSCYLDLANDTRNHNPSSQNYLPQHLTSMPRNKNEYDSRYEKFKSPKYRNLKSYPNRSRSHDTSSVPTVKPPTPPPLPAPTAAPLAQTIPPSPPPLPESTFHYRSKSTETAAAAAAAAAAEAMAAHRFVEGHTTSPHHQKHHRTREHDQARAMAQVVKWLEQEFSLNKTNSKGDLGVTTTTTTTTNKLRNDHPSIVPGTPPPGNPGGNNPSASGSAIEHHHVHEHIHHHYHHYQDSPVLV